MRLSYSEIEKIVNLKDSVFSKETKIFLFGSRVDDSKKGGDIDLFIQSDEDNLLEKKITYLELLKDVFGEQKIDIVYAKDENRMIEQEALKKGIELNLKTIKLEKYFKECDKHVQRIEEAYTDMKNCMPLSVEKYKNLSKDEVQDIDQYLYRFSKLQDTLGDKVFKLIIEEYVDNIDTLSFTDILNRLEKTEYLNSAKEWKYLRELRNEIAHQYDDEADEMTQAINNIVSYKEVIITIYLKLKNRYLSQVNIDDAKKSNI